VDDGGQGVGGIGKVAAGRTSWPVRRQDPGQSLGPVAGAKSRAVLGDAVNDELPDLFRHEPPAGARARPGAASRYPCPGFYMIDPFPAVRPGPAPRTRPFISWSPHAIAPGHYLRPSARFVHPRRGGLAM